MAAPAQPAIVTPAAAVSVRLPPAWLIYVPLATLVLTVVVGIYLLLSQLGDLKKDVEDLKKDVIAQDNLIRQAQQATAFNTGKNLEIETQLRGFGTVAALEKESRIMMDALLFEQMNPGRIYPNRAPQFPVIASPPPAAAATN